jgi:ABC-type nitrate/sulfonate/bicarbonate transport system ATPase subunit
MSTKGEPILRGENLSFSYPGESGVHPVLDGLSVELYPGELLCLLGPSGCGKSTLVRSLASLLPLDSGSLRFRGAPVSAPSPERFVVFQDTHQLLPWLTSRDNVAFAAKHASEVLKSADTSRFLRLVGMEDHADRFPHQLSGGMRQRVALARALAAGGEVLLLDEPFGSLDALTREELQDLLLGIREETSRAFLFVTHDLREAAYLADRIVLMDSTGKETRERRVAISRPRDRDGVELLKEVHSLREEFGRFSAGASSGSSTSR